MVKFQWFSLEKRVKYKINEKKMEGEHMRLHFTKMEGLGNDYVYVNCFKEKVEHPSELAVRVSDRHFGIGSDGLILIKPSEVADFKMDMYNADGTQSEMCAGIAVLGALGAGIGIGIATGKAAEAIARQPEAEGKINKTLILGCALAEATAIYGFVIALMIIVMLK